LKKDWNPFKKKDTKPQRTPPDIDVIVKPGERVGGPGDRIKPMNKQHVEQTLLKLMKGGSFYGGAREPKGGVSQGKLPSGNKGYGREEEVARQEAPLRRDMEARGKETIARRYGQQEPFVNPKSMDKADVPEPKKEKTPEPANVEDVGGVSFPAGEEGKQQMEDWWAQNFPKATGAKEHKEAMEKAGRDMEIAGPDKGRDEIKFRSPVSTHPENVRMPTPEDPRTSSDVQTPSEESNGFGMGDLETRIADKSRNRPTYPDRAKDTPSRKEREGQYQGSGRPKPEQGGNVSASLKALNKMLEEGFLSKKADPAMMAQSRAASRQRGAATQERIAGQAASSAQQVQGPADTSAQQAGQDIASGTSWAAQQAWAETHGEKPEAQPGTQQWNQQQQEGDDDMPNVSSIDALKTYTAQQGKDAGAQPDTNGPGTSGLYGPTGAPLPASSTTGKPTQEAMVPPPKTGFNPAAEGMFQPKTGPTTKPAAPQGMKFNR